MNWLRLSFPVRSGISLQRDPTSATTASAVGACRETFKWLVALVAAGILLAQPALAASVDPLNTALPTSAGSARDVAGARSSLATRQSPAASTPTAAVPEIRPLAPPQFDYATNLNSDVFGANLFTGSFAREGATQFHPDYLVATGDRIQVRLWGAFEFDAPVTVDPKGNVFVPHVGPVPVLGVRNQDLQRVVELAAKRVFKANVYSYASLVAAQPVRVFVSGFVNRPGLYAGTSMDSLLHYLDQAGGIDTERGSFLDVQVKRGERARATISLYDFLLAGKIPLIQLADGDVVFVGPRQRTIRISGLAENAKRFEFAGRGAISVADLARLAKPRPQATHVRVLRNTGTLRSTEYFALAEATDVQVADGDEVEFTADKRPGTITVRVEGEHRSPQEYVLPHGAKLGDLIGRIELSERSEAESLQLFRLSVKERQRVALQTTLKFLENAALTARSATNEEAQLRKEEAELLLKWVERGKNVEPSGQVYIAQSATRDDLPLENGDVLRIPGRDGLVLVSGEVVFPNTIAYEKSSGVRDYIESSGGYTQNADASRVVVAHRDGSFESSASGGSWFSNNPSLRPGDHILVLPKIDVKSRQIFRDVVDALFKIAVIVGIARDF